MTQFEKILSGGDLRSLGESNLLSTKIKDQSNFDELFKCLFHKDRIVVMRAADAIEKITTNNKHYLTSHKNEIIKLCELVNNKELKWHLALVIPRLHLNTKEITKIWDTLTKWAKDKKNSRSVRVNSIQALFEIMKQKKEFVKEFDETLSELEEENIPSLNARIKKLKKTLATNPIIN
jgi:exonuclease VII large subunit